MVVTNGIFSLMNNVYPPLRKRKIKIRKVPAADKSCLTEPPPQAANIKIISHPVLRQQEGIRLGQKNILPPFAFTVPITPTSYSPLASGNLI